MRRGTRSQRSQVTGDRRSLLPWWIVWGTGVAIVPLASLLVPRGGNPLPVIQFLPARPQLLLSASWTLAFGLMFLGMLGLRGTNVRTVALAQICASLLVASMTLAAPSTDQFSYVVFGEIDRHGENPWQPTRVTTNDEVTRVAMESWPNPFPPTPYGPLFILGERALLGVVPHTATYTIIVAQRCVGALAAVGVTLLVRGPRIAFWGLHPLALFEFTLGAHNDVVMLLLIAASMRIRQSFFSGIALGLAPMVKIVALGALLFRSKKGLIPSLLGVVVAIVALLAIEPKAATLAPLLHLAGNARMEGGSPTYLIQKPLESMHLPHPRLAAQIIVISALAVFLYRTRRRWSRRDAPLYGVMILLATLPFLTSNYVSWMLLPTLWASRPLRGVALALTGAAWLLSLGGFMPNNRPHGFTLIYWGAVVLAYGYFFILARPRRDVGRQAVVPAAGASV
jgi:hypothetical protein